MRILPQNALVRVGKAAPEPAGNWLGELKGRSRTAIHPATTTLSKLKYPTQWADQNRILSNEELWRAYVVVPEIRACVNTISRRVATWGWDIAPVLDPSDRGYDKLNKAAKEAAAFLRDPNKENESWQSLLTKLVIDIIVFDALALELVRDKKNELAELVAVRSSDIRPIVDEHGRLLHYVQDKGLNGDAVHGDSKAPKFSKDQMVYERMFPTTSGPEGTPLIESLVNEIVTTMRASEHLMQALDADEIPPGILLLAGLDNASAQRARAEFSANKGKDHKIRVLTTANPQGMSANWIELRHTPKDLTMQESLDQVRRTIWRVFGVSPIEMGETDGAPRAQAQVQVDVSSSHLIVPLLELIAGFVNNQIVPQLVPEEMKGMVKFSFDVSAKLDAQGKKAQGDTYNAYIINGVLTRNEVRHSLGYSPIEGGDIPTITTSVGPLPLKAFLEEGAVNPRLLNGNPGNAPSEPGDVDEEGVKDKAPKKGKEEEPKKKPTKRPAKKPAKKKPARKPKKKRSERDLALAIRAHDDLPSDWQPNGRFAAYRTLDLPSLSNIVVNYAQTVEELWNKTQNEVLAMAVSAVSDENFTPEEAVNLSSRIAQAMDQLSVEWSLATRQHYRSAARLGVDAAREFTKLQVLENWEAQADVYSRQAMGYLLQPTGPIGEVRTRLSTAITDALNNTVSSRSMETRDDDFGFGELFLARIAKAFSSQFFRIFNWSGKLVELANSIVNGGLSEGGVPPTAEEPIAPGAPTAEEPFAPTEPPEELGVWYAEWVHVGDAQMCDTCSSEGGKGIRPVNEYNTVPGGDTECGARCRCVMVYWTEAEVRGGSAVQLGD